MAKNLTINGASFADVPAIDVPQTEGGTARFYDCTGQQEITSNGTFDVTGLASVLVNVAGSGGGLPSGITAIATGDYTVSSAFTTSQKTIEHNMGVVPDLVLFFANGNVAQAYSMLFALRSTMMRYASASQTSYMGYHGKNSTTAVTLTSSTSTSYGVSNLTTTSFTIASAGTSYYWRAGTYKWVAIKF